MAESRAVGRSSVTEGFIVRADGTEEDLGILSSDVKPFPQEFLDRRETVEYKKATRDEVDDRQIKRAKEKIERER